MYQVRLVGTQKRDHDNRLYISPHSVFFRLISHQPPTTTFLLSSSNSSICITQENILKFIEQLLIFFINLTNMYFAYIVGQVWPQDTVVNWTGTISALIKPTLEPICKLVFDAKGVLRNITWSHSIEVVRPIQDLSDNKHYNGQHRSKSPRGNINNYCWFIWGGGGIVCHRFLLFFFFFPFCPKSIFFYELSKSPFHIHDRSRDSRVLI